MSHMSTARLRRGDQQTRVVTVQPDPKKAMSVNEHRDAPRRGLHESRRIRIHLAHD